MAKFIHNGAAIDYTPTADVTAGDVVVVGDVVGVAARDIPANSLGSISVEGVFEFSKASSLVVAAGDRVYYNAGSGNATKTNTDKALGYAVAAAANGATAVAVMIDR